MNDILHTVTNLLPSKRKHTPSGWISFDAVCCHHNGQNKDKRKRGGITFNNDNGFNYHCFNCNFKAGWNPGKPLSSNTKKLFQYLGLDETDIGKLSLIALKIKESDLHIETSRVASLDFKEIPLPKDTKFINEWIQQDQYPADIVPVLDYILNQRKMQWEWYEWAWSPEPGYQDRVIIPFYQGGKIVGWTGRKISPGRPKYLTESQSGYVFNIDRQIFDRQYVIVCEGQFDAIAIDGVALMTNEPNDIQVAKINSLNREVICVPDRDSAGAKILTYCIKNNWSVSLPPWGDAIKDVADAVKMFGRLYTLKSILHYRVRGEIKIQLIKNKLLSNG